MTDTDSKTNIDSIMDDSINVFRRASRELYNNHFRPVESDGNDAWLTVESFQVVESVLFEQLVTKPLSIERVAYGEVQPEIAVVFRYSGSGDMPALINTEIHSPDWEHPTEKVLSPDTLLRFVCFFDFESPNICIDNQYVKVKIVGHKTKPELIGKYALLNSYFAAYKIGGKEW